MTPPPVAVMVMLLVPVWALLFAVTVKVELPVPGAAMLLGLKVTDSYFVRPEAEREIEELNETFALVVMVVEVDDPWATMRPVLVAESVKSGGVEELTVRLTVVVSLSPPPEP